MEFFLWSFFPLQSSSFMNYATLLSLGSHTVCASNKSCIPLSYFSITTPWGNMIAIADNEYLYALHFENSNSLTRVIKRLHNTHCFITRSSKLEPLIRHELSLYFSHQLIHFTIPYKFIGTAFQQSVWNALTTVRPGTTATYHNIAMQIGNPQGARAVGNANNSNPISIIIPCHRIIGTNKKLTGYAAGLYIKKALLDHEGYTTI